MASITASSPHWLGRPGSSRIDNDAAGDGRHSIDSMPPFSIEAAGLPGAIGFSSSPEAADDTAALYDGGYFDLPGAHGCYPADNISWTQPESIPAATSAHQPSLIDAFDPFIAGNLVSSQPPRPTSVGDTAGYLFDSLPVPTDAALPNDESSTSLRRPRSRTRLRRQNHACDQCRSSKKACDLPRGVAVRNGRAVNPCTSCDIRELDCAVSWLTTRQLVRQDDKGSRGSGRVPGRGRASRARPARSPTPAHPQGLDTTGQICTLDGNLSRQVVAERACSLKFNLYIDISDSYLSQCVTKGSMPSHFNFGIVAYDNLSKHPHLSTHVERVEQWVASCWKGSDTQTTLPFTPGPCMLRAVGLLDTLFSAAPPGSSRDAAITEAFRWMAIATAAQMSSDQSEEGSESTDGTRSHQRDFALASWRKAKELIFANMAATKSFRLALALNLFGHIVPPSGASPYSQVDQDSEDRDYAYCEGTRRLEENCKKARSLVIAQMDVNQAAGSIETLKTTKLEQMPNDVCELVLELIGSLEWLMSLSNSVAAGVSYGKVCSFPLDVDRGEQSPISNVPLRQDREPRTTDQDALALVSRQSHQASLETSILRRARQGGVSFIDVCRSNIHDSDAVLYAGRLPIALSTLTWRFLARFTIGADALQSENPHQSHRDVWRHYIAMISHIGLWRTTFGTMDHTLRETLRNSPREVWRMFAFCSVDTDLAILLFCDAAQKLEVELKRRPSLSAGGSEDLLGVLHSTQSYRNEQKLISAAQTALVSSTCQASNTTSASFAQQQPTYGRDMCAHPNPWVLLQAHLLSVQTFSEAIKQPCNFGDAERVSELKKSMNTCFQGLSKLREIFCITPIIDMDAIA